MSTRDDNFLRSLRATFAVEAEEHVQSIASGLLDLEKHPASDALMQVVGVVFRAAHSLKGAARAVSFSYIEKRCQSLEDLFSRWKRQKQAPSPQELDSAHALLDAISRALSAIGVEGNSAETAEPLPVDTSAQYSSGQNPPMSVYEAKPQEKMPPGETVRISIEKLDARLLEAEELLLAKLTTTRHAAEMRELITRFDLWKKEWASIQPEVRALRQASEHQISLETLAATPSLNRVVEFFEWNHDYLRTLEGKVEALSQTTSQDRLAVGKLVDDLLEDSKKLLMLPLSTLGTLFPKIVRDLCRDQGKEADLIINGDDVEIDKRVLEEMKDPFIHLLRNCVDHGIETPEQRVKRGKSARATITLSVVPVAGNKVELVVSDDGAGIDTNKVRESAVRNGLISADEARALSDSEAHALIFQADVSTSPMITELSGRGLGLAIVREKAEKLGGTVTVESRVGQGTQIRIVLPAMLATFRGILVESAGQELVVPITHVTAVMQLHKEAVHTVEGREVVAFNERAIALIHLADILELPDTTRRRDAAAGFPAIVLGANDQNIAFTVDAVLGEQEVLVKRLPRPLSRVRNISGATILSSGHVAPILNVADLFKSARKAGGAIAPTVASTKPTDKRNKSILVVEDSITSRMLLKGIIESAGYQVKTAVDGLEGFTLLRAEEFQLVVSDVEMPRMDGFDLTQRIRADKKLAEIPVILVTALETREDRERGIDVGANAYIVKSNFDQSNLLDAIRRLV